MATDTKTRTRLRGSVTVAVNLTLEVDPVNWAIAYGEFSRDDVKQYVLGLVQGSAASDEDGGIIRAQVKA